MMVVWYPLILAAILAGGAALALVVARSYAARREPGLQKSLKALASGLGAEEKGDCFSVDHEGIVFDIKLRPAAGSAACLEISTNLDSIARDASEAPAGYRGNPSAKVLGRPTIHVWRKTWWSRLGERLRVVRAADTGDAAFDEMVWIEASAPDEDIRRVLSEPRARSAVLDIVKAGADRITINAEGAALVVAFSARDEQTINVFTFMRAASGIAFAAPFLPVFGAQDPKRTRLPLVGALWGLSLLALLSTPFVITTSLHAGSPSSFWSAMPLAGFAVGLAVWGLLVPLLGRLLRRSFGARLHLFGMAAALLTALPAHGAAAPITLSAVIGPMLVVRGYIAADWLQDDYEWGWAPLEPVPPVVPSHFEGSAFVIQSASVARLAPSSQTLELYVRLWNEADAPRWFVVPWRADRAGIAAGEPIHALGAHELRGRGRVLVVELLRKDGGGAQAFLVPGRASISIERLMITGEFRSLPRVIPVKAFVARGLSIGGMPLEAWFGEGVLSDRDAVVVDERQGGRARRLNVHAGQAGHPTLELDEVEGAGELSLRQLAKGGD